MNTVLKNYSISFKKLFPMLQKRSKLSYIALAVLIIAAQQAHSFLYVPKHLRGFPKVSFISMVKSYYYKESVADRQRRLVAPLIKEGHGFYIVSLFINRTSIVYPNNLYYNTESYTIYLDYLRHGSCGSKNTVIKNRYIH